jgi:hypothetical protein
MTKGELCSHPDDDDGGGGGIVFSFLTALFVSFPSPVT